MRRFLGVTEKQSILKQKSELFLTIERKKCIFQRLGLTFFQIFGMLVTDRKRLERLTGQVTFKMHWIKKGKG